VGWPSDTPAGGNGPLYICTLGDDPFRGDLEATVANKLIDARTVAVRHFKLPQDALGCNVVFVSKSETSRASLILAYFRRAPVLTVGDQEDFLGAGGMIRLFLDGKRVRFEINRSSADMARLKVSAQLLLLARNSTDGNGGR
jgi:hypothetical protein